MKTPLPNLYIFRWTFGAPGLPARPTVVLYCRAYSVPDYGLMKKYAIKEGGAEDRRLKLEGISTVPYDYLSDKDYFIIDLTNHEAPELESPAQTDVP